MAIKESSHCVVEIETDAPLEKESHARFVTWIAWDSGFRGSGLRIGDLIIGHQDVRYDATASTDKIRIGDVRFPVWCEQQSLKPGDPFTVQILRNDETLVITGRVGSDRRYFDAASERRTLGDGGPVAFEKDGFDSAWGTWYSQFVDLAKTTLAGWDYIAGASSIHLSARAEEFSERVDFLLHRYPGDFASATADDLAAMRKMVAGEKRDLTPADLSYRTLGAERASAISAAADEAFTGFLREVDGALLKDAPRAPNSFRDNIRALFGQMVRLPELGRAETLYETRRSWFWAGEGGSTRVGGYLVDRNAEMLAPLYVAMREYTEKVDPAFRDATFSFIGVVERSPALVADVDRKITVTGVKVRPIAAMVTNANDRGKRFFVDLRKAGESGADKPGASEAFAGERALEAGMKRPALAPEASPAQVLEAAFAALKVGDMNTWLGFFADWQVRRFYERDGSYAWVDLTWITVSEQSGMGIWNQARKRLLDDVHGVEVARVSTPRVVFDQTLESGEHVGRTPRIVEEVRATVNHIGKFGDEYRTFCGGRLHRAWCLQRLDDGPWRITVAQAL